jgi:hypothetical protein
VSPTSLGTNNCAERDDPPANCDVIDHIAGVTGMIVAVSSMIPT